MACPITLYTILKDFSLPLVALTWAVYSWYRDNKRVLSIRQVGDAYSERVADTPTGITTFSIEVVVTNDSPRTNIVIAYYDLELPRKTMILTLCSIPETLIRRRNFTRYIPSRFRWRGTRS
jgi:hypothetical protein